jgi:TetR/AcrR family transcriptional regulator, copper-responsive repressor
MTISRPRGRPRSFDRDKALDVAMRAFWRSGYDTVSIAELTSAIGITPPSLYAAFGDKATLFREVVARYQATYGAFFGRALAREPTVREGVHRALREAAMEYTNPEHPPGCLVFAAAVNYTTESADIAAMLREQRAANAESLRRRIESEGGPSRLAVLVAVVLEGMSQHARDGATTDQLLDVAEATMLAWPD